MRSAAQFVSNKELDASLKLWLDFNDFVDAETLQSYHSAFLDKRCRQKWIHFMRELRMRSSTEELSMAEYNRRMCVFADGLCVELNQSQYDGNHYTQQILNEDEDEEVIDSDY